MDELKKPQKIKDMAWEKSAEAYTLIDKETNKTYSLDPIAFLVWVQCDGKTEVDKIVDVFAVDGNRDIVKAAIGGILDKLSSSGLVKWV
ncbi:MAG: PqqD family protein [Candidatus Aenigmarchaeota archaeon]|nr:PqqD family protein [Candidatus Aenigmarchaeota archaeon]